MNANELEMLLENLTTNVKKCDRALYLMDILEKKIKELESASNNQYELKCANVKLNRLRSLKTKWDGEWLSLVESAYKTIT